MQLYLFRHGIAEPANADGNDAARRLTEDGIRKTRKATQGLAQLVGKVDVILTSPRIRAQQTAQILAQTLDMFPEVMNLLGQDVPCAILDALARRSEEHVLIVGHEPTFSRIIERLCAPKEDRNFIELRKAGCACVEVQFTHPQPRGTLQWLATPKMLRDIARKR